MLSMVVSTLRKLLFSVFIVFIGAASVQAGFHPRQYMCYRTSGSITIDGKLDEASWLRAPSTEHFGNMQAPPEPQPYYNIRVKMLWDDEYMYFGAMLEDPNVWGTVSKRDGLVYDNSDLAIFIDIDSDGWWYYEFGINCLNTVYDLLIEYRGARLGIEWDIKEIKTAVQIDGTLNFTDDVDRGWTVEIAWPMKSLAEYAGTMPIPPHDGDKWRVDFVRVYVTMDDESRSFQMKPGSHRDKWMWSPHRYVRMHNPQSWGKVIFSTQMVGTQDDTLDQLKLQPVFLTIDPKISRKKIKPGSMVHIPAGECIIGPNPLAGPKSRAEKVYVNAFYIDKYEVTVAQYASFLNAAKDEKHYHPFMAHEGCGIVKDSDGIYRVQPGRGNYPMVFVAQTDAEAFAAWDGKRLPTHEEWEKACRFDDNSTYPWGSGEINTALANYDYLFGCTVPVGSFPEGVTSKGIHDMAGNVWEICGGTKIYNKGRRIVCRGGGWVSSPKQVHASVDLLAAGRCRYIGFRCARDAE